MPDTDDQMSSLPIVPLMPTGNGVTDLETAREQSALANAAHTTPADLPPMDETADGPWTDEGEAAVDDNRPTLSE